MQTEDSASVKFKKKENQSTPLWVRRVVTPAGGEVPGRGLRDAAMFWSPLWGRAHSLFCLQIFIASYTTVCAHFRVHTVFRIKSFQKGSHLHCWWECKLVLPLWKTAWRFVKKLKIELPFDPAVPLLGVYPEKTLIQKDTHTPRFTAKLFTIAKTEQPNFHQQTTG